MAELQADEGKDLVRANDTDPFGSMKNPLRHFLETDVNFRNMYEEAKEKGFHIYSVMRHVKEWEHLSESERDQRHCYLPICSLDEIERILNPQNISDYLLFLRAESIVSNMRILRTIEARACHVALEDWSLASQFDDSIFEIFEACVAEPILEKAGKVQCGTLFTDEPNAMCILTDFDKLIVISEALKYFLFFMNLAYSDLWNLENQTVPQDVKRHAALIGIRTMLLTEAFDFELDPRGEIPEVMRHLIEDVVKRQSMFIIAHEYGHILLGHLDMQSLAQVQLSHFCLPNPKFPQGFILTFTRSQVKEFDADLKAIELLESKSKIERKSVLWDAILVFSYLEIFETVYGIMTSGSTGHYSHPPAAERRLRIIDTGRDIWDGKDTEIINSILNYTDTIKGSLVNLANSNPKMLTSYGSVYLGQWRGVPRIDRVDF